MTDRIVVYEPKTGDYLQGPDGHRVLVGDINKGGGQCGCCGGGPWGNRVDDNGLLNGVFLLEGWTVIGNLIDDLAEQ